MKFERRRWSSQIPAGHGNDRPKPSCWPASPRDWLTAQCAVRLGRLDKTRWIRIARRTLVHGLARNHESINFATPYEFTVFLPCDYTSLVLGAMDGELFHPLLLQLLEQIVLPGDAVVDGGSYVGVFSLLAARRMQGRGQVVAFEPQPDTFALLENNIRVNRFLSLIRPVKKALTNQNTTFEFSIVVEQPMMSSLSVLNDTNSERIQVAGVRLDDYLKTIGFPSVDVIKLDLEGAEPLALAGMQQSLMTARILICEVNEPQLTQRNVDPIRMIQDTATAGSFESVLFVSEREHQVRKFHPDAFLSVLRKFKFVNVVCAKRGALPEGWTAGALD